MYSEGTFKSLEEIRLQREAGVTNEQLIKQFKTLDIPPHIIMLIDMGRAMAQGELTAEEVAAYAIGCETFYMHTRIALGDTKYDVQTNARFYVAEEMRNRAEDISYYLRKFERVAAHRSLVPESIMISGEIIDLRTAKKVRRSG